MVSQGFYHDMDADGYHADPCELPSLNYSTAKLLETESEWHAWKAHPRLGGEGFVSTPAMDKGSIIHALLLGQKLDSLEIIDANDYRKKDTKALRDTAKSSGKLVILKREWDEINGAIPMMRENLKTAGIVLDGHRELTAIWEAGGALNRTRIDHVTKELTFPIDLKCTESANPRFLDKHIVEMCYDIQGAAIIEAIETIEPELVGRVNFADVFIETEYPYFVVKATHSESMKELGRSRWQRNRRKWNNCISTNTWRGFVNDVIVHAPNWAINKEFGESL